MPATTTRTRATPRKIKEEIFFAHRHPGIKPNPKSLVFQEGYADNKGHCWWRGCSYCHDTQEFADWQAGWHKAYNESH